MGAERITAYTEWARTAIQRAQSQEAARGLFLQYTHGFEDVSEKVISIHHAVEQVEGRLYGVAVCYLREAPSSDELHDLKYYCREQFGEGWGEGYAHSPRKASDKGLYIHFWQDESDLLWTRSELDSALKAGQITNQPLVREINKDTFWTLIEEAKRLWGQDLDSSAKWLGDQLLMMDFRQTLNFYDILHGYLELSYQYGLWNAAILIMENGCYAEDFADFRAWLIAQGKETYLAALKNPDSLADIPPYGDCRFRSLYYLGDWIFEKQMGRSDISNRDKSIRNALLEDLRKEIQYDEDIGYPHEWSEVAAYLPRLAAQHMTEEELRACRYRRHMWNHEDPEIRKARAAAFKKKKSRQLKRGDAR